MNEFLLLVYPKSRSTTIKGFFTQKCSTFCQCPLKMEGIDKWSGCWCSSLFHFILVAIHKIHSCQFFGQKNYPISFGSFTRGDRIFLQSFQAFSFSVLHFPDMAVSPATYFLQQLIFNCDMRIHGFTHWSLAIFYNYYYY